MTGLETTLSTGFDAMLKRIDQNNYAAAINPVRSNSPPRRSFGPRRNLQDVTCYACGQKAHYTRDCKGASFSALPSRNLKQEEISGALGNMPIGDFTMAAVWDHFAPNGSSHSLDDSLDNLHRWATGTGVPISLVWWTKLTNTPQVELPSAPFVTLPTPDIEEGLFSCPGP